MNKPFKIISWILLVLGAIFLLAFLVQVTYNNSIVKMSICPETKKPRLVEITYWESLILCFFVGFLFPSTVITIAKNK